MRRLLALFLFLFTLPALATTYTVTATHLTMHVGDPLPPLIFYSSAYTGTYASVFNGQPALSTTATSSSPVGNYPIVITAGGMSPVKSADSLTFVNGTLSVIPADADGAQLTPSVSYPPGFFDGPAYGAINVTSNTIASLDNTCTLDDTAGINALLQGSRTTGATVSSGRTTIYLYFPPGCYRITGQIQSYGNHWYIYGAGPQSTRIKLDPNVAAFNTGTETPVFSFNSVGGNQNFLTFISNIGIEIGPGNPSAEILKWVSNNVGELNNVQLWADDSNCIDGLGLHNAYPGPTMIRNVAIYGCTYGIDAGQSEYSVTFDGLTTEGQTTNAVYLRSLKLSVQHWLSDNRVTAWNESGPASNAAVLDSEMFYSGTAATPGINNQASATFYARNIASTGYSPTEVDSSTGTSVNYTGNLTENWSGAAQSIFNSGQAAGSLNLPEAETPTPNAGAPSTWTELGPNPANWCATIQGSTNPGVYLPPGVYAATANVNCTIPDSVNFLELYGSLFGNGSASYNINFTVAGSSSTPLVIDGCEYNNCYLIHTGPRSVAITNSEIGYQDTPGVTHSVFFEDDQINSMAGIASCAGNGPTFYSGTTVYGRQFDDELGSTTDTTCWKFTADGAKVWMLGYKTERDSPSAILTNGAQAELFGFFNYQLNLNPPPANSAPIYLVDSSLFATGYSQIGVSGQPYEAPNWVNETQGSTSGSLVTPDLITSQNLSMFYSYGATVPNSGSAGPFLLTVSAQPGTGGTIAASPASSDGEYASGTVVTLTATPATGYSFTGWKGDVSDSVDAQTTVTMGSAEVVYANFVASSTGGAGGSSFGNVNVGTSATIQALSYKFTATTTLASVNVLTTGAPGRDFSDGGSSTCAAGTTYTSGQSCVVTVGFIPNAPGIRTGAVTLFSTKSTTPIKTFYLSGIGQSSIVTIDPGTQTLLTTLGNGGMAFGSAVDGAGNTYVVDNANSQVFEVATGTNIVTTVISSGLLNPTALTLDGAGNLYIADSGNNRVAFVPNGQGALNSASLSTFTIAGLGTPTGLATDGGGTLYVADSKNNNVIKIPAAGGTPTTIAANLSSPQGIALDSANDVFITSGNKVTEYPAGGGTPVSIGTGFSEPTDLAVDASGTIYVADSGNARIVEVMPRGTPQRVLATPGISSPFSISLDSTSNLYITSAGSVYQLNRILGSPLGFPSTDVNSISATQSLTLSDAGNKPLTFSSIALSPNFIQGSSGSTDCTGSTQLAVAGQCYVAVAFAPTTVGQLTGTLTLNDSSLNQPSTEVIQLSGTSTVIPQTITFPTIASPTFGGNAVTLGATSTSGLAISYTVLQGPATVAGSTLTTTGAGSVTVQAAQAGNTNYSAATAVTQTFTVNQSNQTISFPTIAAQIFGSSVAVSATATSQLPVSFASATPSVCTVSSSSVAAIAAGTCTITASQAGNTNYAAATSVNESFLVNQATQTIAFAALQNATYGDPAIPLAATATSSLPVSFVVLSGPGTVNGSSLGITGAGSITVQAVQAGNANYLAAASVSQAITVNPQATTVTWPTPTAISYGTPLGSSQLNATATVAGTFAYAPAAGTVLNAGTQALTVIFTPTSTNYASSTGGTTLGVNQAALAVSAQSGSSTYGQPLPPLTYTITGFVNGDTQASAVHGAAALSTTASPTSVPGPYPVIIAQGSLSSANYRFGGFISGVLTQQQAPSSATLVSLNSSLYPGQATTLTATVSIAGSGSAPTQSVTFYAGATALGTTTLVPIDATDAAATLTLNSSQLALGANSVTASYAGDGNYAASASTASVVTLATPQANFGPVSVGTATASQTLTYSFTSAATLTAVNILSEGTPSLDYTDGGNSTCTAGTAYAAGQSCVVNVAFTAIAPGARPGAVALFAQGSKLPLQSFYLTGTGQASVSTIDPGTQSTLGTLSNSSVVSSQVIDGAGNIYVADSANNQVIRLAAGTFKASTVISSGLLNPGAVALDGAGNLYIADTGNSRVVLIPNEQGHLNASDMATLAINGLGTPNSLAMDGSGNLYVGDAANGNVVELAAISGATVTLASGITNLSAIAVDTTGDLYVASGNLVNEYVTGSNKPVAMGTGFTAPGSLAVDAAGAIYVADAGSGQISIVAPGGASQTVLSTGVSTPGSVALDAAANIYVSAGAALYEVNRTVAASLNFGKENITTTSSPQTLTVSDAGNQPLALAGLAFSSNFAQGTAGGTDCTSSTQVAIAAQCSIVVDFAPTATGPLTGTLVVNTNAFNAAGGQSVQLAGSGTFIAQTIAFPAIGTQVFGSGAFTLNASATSGLPITYSVISGPAAVAGNSLSTSGAGSVTVEADQGGSTDYSAASAVTQTFTVNPASQTITFATIAAQTLGGAPVALSASATSQLPISFASTTPLICSVNGTSVSTLGAGTCAITASQAGSANYSAAASVSRSFVVNAAAQTITFPVVPAQTFGGGPIALSATATSQLPVTFTSSTPAVCAVSGSSASVVAAGTCTVIAAQSGNTNYSAASPVAQSFIVNPATQTITFAAIAAQTFGGAPASLSASATSQLPVSFTSTTPAVCTVSGNAVASIGAGTCTVAASQAGNNNYSAAPAAMQSFVINPSAQTITFSTIPSQTFGGASATLSASATSQLAVSFASTTPAVCAVTGNSVSTVAAGSCTVTASQPGNANYGAAAAVSQTFTVNQASQTITFATIATQTFGAAPATLSATATSQLPVTFVSTTPSVCGVSGGSVATLASGTCSITASQVGNTNYIAASPVSRSFTVSAARQTITFAALAAQTVGASLTVSATSTSQLPVSFATNTPTICTLAGSTVTAIAAGTCSVQASQAGSAQYAAATAVNEAFVVSQVAQTITFATIPSQLVGASLNLTATSTSSLPVSFTVTTPTICSISGSTLTVNAAGTCSVQAVQAGNAEYKAATPVTHSFTAGMATQSITFATIAAQSVGSSLNLVATASSQLPVTFADTTSTICTLSGSTVTMVAAGTCSITASQSGNTDYAAATAVTHAFTVAQVAQTITFSTIPTQLVGAAVTLTPTASSSLAVSLASTTPTTCSLSGSVVTALAVGSCSVTASQTGNAEYKTATAVTQSFAIAQATQTITFTAIPSQVVTAAVALSASSTSRLPVTFASSTASVCTVSGSVATTIAAGTCTIQASQAGNTQYKAATTVANSFAVTQTAQSISFASIGTQAVGASISVSPVATSGLAVTLTDTTPSICTLSGSTITTIAAGTCTIQAAQAGNAQYKAATTVTDSFTVGQTSQSVTFTMIASQSVGASVTLAPTATSGLTVTLADNTPAVCTLSGYTVTGIAAGTCTIQAAQAGNAQYKPATTITQSFTVSQVAQTITFTSVPAQLVSASVALKATATSQLPVVFSTTTPAVCTVSGATVSTIAAGSCSVQAAQAGNAEYKAATTVTNTFTVSQVAQTITFAVIDQQNVGATMTLAPTTTSGLAVSLADSTTAVCTLSGSTVTTVAAGTCSITAAQAGNASYKAATSVVRSFTVSQVAQTITFATIASQKVGATVTLSATSTSQLPISYASTTATSCTVSGSTLKTIAAGSCTVQASQAGNAEYKSATSVAHSLTVSN